jgi:RNA polymerase sigma-70 factor (ECF subfamily)
MSDLLPAMRPDADPRTRASLLLRLRRDPTDQAVWAEIVGRYGPLIHGWCLRWRLQEADAQDVTQDVLLRLATRLRDLDYDPARSFRAWLKTLARHACSDAFEKRARPGGGSGDSRVADLLDTVEARDDLLRRLEEGFDQEVLAEAGERVRRRVAAATWEAFRLTAVDGLSGAAAAERLGLKVATVFSHRRNVQKLLQDEVRRLSGEA